MPVLLCTAVLAALCGCERAGPAPAVALSACRLNGIERELQCGNLSVPENPALPGGRHIPIHFAVLKALARSPLPDPVFIIAGGPGQSATGVAGLVLPLFARLNRDRDLVFIDQRGTGGSHPLECLEDSHEAPLARQFDVAWLERELSACPAKLAQDGTDLTQYTTDIAVGDFEAVRAALHYPTINLWGASYGTRVELEYLRRYPASIRSAVLDGVAPSDMKLPVSMAIDADAALTGLMRDCSADPACAGQGPPLNATLTQLLDSTRAHPVTAEVAHPVTGLPQTVRVDRLLLTHWLRGPLYSTLTASLLPLAIRDAAHARFGPLVAANFTSSDDSGEGVSYGMHLAVVCNEDMNDIGPTDLAAAQKTRFGTDFYEFYQRACAAWPRRRLPASYFEPVRSSVPVLLLAGGDDPATPPRHAERVLETLSQGKLLVAPHVGHGVSLQGCGARLVERFITDGNAAHVDGACLEAIPRPPFFSLPDGPGGSTP